MLLKLALALFVTAGLALTAFGFAGSARAQSAALERTSGEGMELYRAGRLAGVPP
jgi:hypothetical protein